MKNYIICSVPSQILYGKNGKNLVPKIWAKMVPASQTPGFLNQPFLQNKSMKQHNSLQVDTNSHKLKADQKFFS